MVRASPWPNLGRKNCAQSSRSWPNEACHIVSRCRPVTFHVPCGARSVQIVASWLIGQSIHLWISSRNGAGDKHITERPAVYQVSNNHKWFYWQPSAIWPLYPSALASAWHPTPPMSGMHQNTRWWSNGNYRKIETIPFMTWWRVTVAVQMAVSAKKGWFVTHTD